MKRKNKTTKATKRSATKRGILEKLGVKDSGETLTKKVCTARSKFLRLNIEKEKYKEPYRFKAQKLAAWYSWKGKQI